MRHTLLPLLATLLTGCLVDFPPLPKDGQPIETGTDGPSAEARPEAGTDGPLADLDQGPTPDGPDGPKPDVKPPPDTAPPPDTWDPCLQSWNAWTCTPSVNSCTSTCGSYQVICNKNICNCGKGGLSQSCGSASSTACSGCQDAYNSGCCQGL